MVLESTKRGCEMEQWSSWELCQHISSIAKQVPPKATYLNVPPEQLTDVTLPKGCVAEAIVTFIERELSLGVQPSRILFEQNILKLGSWIRYHQRMASEGAPKKSCKELDTAFIKLLNLWREEILSSSIPRPRPVFDFKAFDRVEYVWDEWLELYDIVSIYPELYPLYADIIRDYTCLHMSSLVDFYVSTTHTLHEALILSNGREAGIKYSLAFVTAFVRWAIAYALGLQRTFFLFQTSSMLVFEDFREIETLLRFLKSRNFFIVHSDGIRTELASPNLKTPNLLNRFRELTLTSSPENFGDEVIVTLFADVKLVNKFKFERSLTGKPLFPQSYSSDRVVVTGRNTFLLRKWVHNLSRSTGIKILHLGFAENEAVEEQCRLWVKSYVNILYCHIQLVDHGLAGDIFGEARLLYNYGLVNFCLRIVYHSCLELEQYFDTPFYTTLWRVLVRKRCQFIRLACNCGAIQKEDSGMSLNCIVTVVCSSSQIISRALEECPDIDKLSSDNLDDLTFSIQSLAKLYETIRYQIDPSTVFDIECCIKTLERLSCGTRPKSHDLVVPTPDKLICINPQHRIYKGYDETLGRILVYKEVKPVKDNNMVTEIDFSTLLQSHELVECHGLLITSKGTFIKLEYCPLRSLEDVVSSTGPCKSAAEVSIIGFLLLRGLGFLHSNRVVHGALTPSNILLDAFSINRLTDYGCARYLAPSSIQYSKGVIHSNTAYLAPETIRDGTTSMASDIWSIGCVLYYVMTGKHPYSECTNHLAIIQKLGVSKLFDTTLLEEGRAVFGDDIVDIVLSCLSMDPEKRPDSFALRFHPFFYIPYPE